MNVAQAEYFDMFSDPLPTPGVRRRMLRLLLNEEDLEIRIEKKQAAVAAINKHYPGASYPALQNELTQLWIRLRETRAEIVNVARWIVAEDAALEVRSQ